VCRGLSEDKLGIGFRPKDQLEANTVRVKRLMNMNDGINKLERNILSVVCCYSVFAH